MSQVYARDACAGSTHALPRFWGNELDQFSTACHRMMDHFHNVMPKGCNRARIRASARPTLQPKEDTLESTLGDEAIGLVCIDLAGAPLKYDQMSVFSDAVARHTSMRLELHTDDGRGWRRAGAAEIPADAGWRDDYVAGAQFLKEQTYVPASEDPY